jgi:hypothetical protein
VWPRSTNSPPPCARSPPAGSRSIPSSPSTGSRTL